MASPSLKHKQLKAKVLPLAILLGICGSTLSVSAASADGADGSRRTDIFGSTQPTKKNDLIPNGMKKSDVGVGNAGAGAIGSGRTPETAWFEQIDDIRDFYRTTAAQRAVLDRPINGDAERLKEWRETLGQIANNFDACAKKIHAAEVPLGDDDIKKFRNLTSDWYTDTATIYRDMLTPRPAAKTIEALQDELKEYMNRQGALRRTLGDLAQLEINLRNDYRVHKDIHTDPLMKYIMGKDSGRH